MAFNYGTHYGKVLPKANEMIFESENRNYALEINDSNFYTLDKTEGSFTVIIKTIDTNIWVNGYKIGIYNKDYGSWSNNLFFKLYLAQSYNNDSGNIILKNPITYSNNGTSIVYSNSNYTELVLLDNIWYQTN